MSKQKSAYLFGLIAICVVLFSCGKKGGGGGGGTGTPVVPVVKVSDASTARATSDGVMFFTISVNRTTSVAVTVDYTLANGTAISPRDYTTSSGTATIPANQTTASVSVPIKGDPLDTRQDNLAFTITLSNPKNCTLDPIPFATGTIITENGSYLATDNTGYTTPTTYPGYTLAWSDEFSGTTLDASVWNQETGNNNGWGNHELENYTTSAKNTFVSHGNLIIEARKESVGGFNYSSGRMTTQNKKTFKFGRIDIRAKLPVIKGIWPALWALGSNIATTPWPLCGEMDMMELVGNFPGRVYGTMHYADIAGNHASKGTTFTLSSGDFSQQFHVFSTVWIQDQIKLYVDDQLYLTVVKADIGTGTYPFNAPEFFLFNIAVGGDFPGAPDAASAFPPQRMFVDYIRVFQ